MPASDVTTFLDDLRLAGDGPHALVLAVRALVHATLPEVTEQVKYGGLMVASGGTWFGGVFAYRAHVSLEFGRGAAIADPFGHLEGAGKGRRHLKLREPGDLAAKRVADYLPLALAAAASPEA